MAINGISTQQVSGISPNAGVSANGGASIESVSNAISAAANKGITPAGPTVTERDSRGSTYASRRTTTITAIKWSIWKAARRPESFPICRLNSNSSNPFAPEGA